MSKDVLVESIFQFLFLSSPVVAYVIAARDKTLSLSGKIIYAVILAAVFIAIIFFIEFVIIFHA